MTAHHPERATSSIALLSRDLIFSSRVIAGAARAGIDVVRAEDPDQLPRASDGMVLIVDWGSRAPGWEISLPSWMQSAVPAPRLMLFGPHADVDAARLARAARLGPMVARSRLADRLREVLEPMEQEKASSGRGA